MSTSKSYDILVLGATGFTGKLVTRYLYAHPQFRSQFSFAVGARSRKKLDDLAQELSLDKDVKCIQVDVTDDESVVTAIRAAKIVINTVGPFWKSSTPVVRACVQNGIHYVDITGEAFWIHELIREFDYAATRTGAIIIPSCGHDSVPSDVVAFLSNKALKQISSEAEMGESVTAFAVKGGFSGGTFSTAITMLDEAPKDLVRRGMRDYCNSPVQGLRSPKMRLLYKLPYIQPPIYGCPWFMQPVNRRLVQRTWGLAQARLQTENPTDELRRLSYGPKFTYDEFFQCSSKISAIVTGLALSFAMFCFVTFKPVRWLISKLAPPGSGPSEERMKNGYLKLTNISTSSNLQRPIVVKTVLRGRGDPGYLLTSVMVAESALSILLNRDSLSSFAKAGGIHTPMSALGDVLIQRLEESGRFEFEYGRLESGGKKTR